MAAKILVGSLVILVVATVGTVGMMYVNNSIAIPRLDECPASTGSSEHSCPSSQDTCYTPCNMQPKTEAVHSECCPAPQPNSAADEAGNK